MIMSTTAKTMNPEAKRLWLAEFPNWTQTHRHLADADSTGRCCLGVLCEAAVKAGVIPPPVAEEQDHGDEWLRYGDPEHGEVHVLPPEVRRWAGLDSNPMIPGLSTLAELNDGSRDGKREPMSFEEIQVLIKDQL